MNPSLSGKIKNPYATSEKCIRTPLLSMSLFLALSSSFSLANSSSSQDQKSSQDTS